MQAGLFAVTGNPVFHSRSPQMFMAAFKALGLPHCYTRLAADSAKEALGTAQQMGMRGLNVTAPYKEQMFEAVDVRQADLKKLCAANTVVFGPDVLGPGTATGFNTDIHGVAMALTAHAVRLDGAHAVVLGAGGAARAAVQALVSAGAYVTVANRTVERAQQIAADFQVRASSLAEAELKSVMDSATVVVSCLGVMDRVVPASFLRKEQVVLEANYAKESSLVADAKACGAKVIDGREWLLYQGVGAFEHFLEMRAPLEAMREAVYSAPVPAGKSIALIGFMGSGKSVTAELLARSLNLEHCSLDQQIEKNANMSVPSIFEKKGEDEFRRQESAALAQIVQRGPVLLSCGGGVVTRSENLELLQKHFITVWLWATPESILKRLANDSSRPLLAAKNKHEVVYDLLRQRMPMYSRAANLVLSTEGRSVEQVAERIKNEVCKSLQN